MNYTICIIANAKVKRTLSLAIIKHHNEESAVFFVVVLYILLQEA